MIDKYCNLLQITAKTQTAGIGHEGRNWLSPRGNIYVTYIIQLPMTYTMVDESKISQSLFFVPQITNLAICDTVEMYGLNPEYKWINDMLISNKKCAGSLCEGKGDFPCFNLLKNDFVMKKVVVIGIGLNVNMTEEEADKKYQEIKDPLKVKFTSMSIESNGTKYEVDKVLNILTHNILRSYDALVRGREFSTWFLPQINSRLSYIGKEVVYEKEAGSEHVKAVLKGLGNKGEAILEFSDGVIKSIITGRIRPL